VQAIAVEGGSLSNSIKISLKKIYLDLISVGGKAIPRSALRSLVPSDAMRRNRLHEIRISLTPGVEGCDCVMISTTEEGIFLQLIIRPTTESGFWAFS